MCCLGETPKRMIAKFGMKNVETLSYILLSYSVYPSSAILELFASESPILRFCNFRGKTAYARFYHHEGITISILFTSSKFVTNRSHFQVIAKTGPTGQLHYNGIANGSHPSVQKTKTNWTFRNLQCSFMPESQPPE